MLKTGVTKLDVTVDTLSGSNQRRVCLARVLKTSPAPPILDEPTRGMGLAVLLPLLIPEIDLSWPRMVSLIEALAMMIILQGMLLAITHGNAITDLPERPLPSRPDRPRLAAAAADIRACFGRNDGFLCLTLVGGDPLVAASAHPV